MLLSDGQQPPSSPRLALRRALGGGSAGIGLARLGRFHTQAEVAAGRLVTVLEDFNPGDIEVIHAVYLGQGGFVPARMRAFIDFLARNVKIRA